MKKSEPASRIFTVDTVKIVLMQGDITDQDTDAIVNAANSSLMGGGGVDGAIHRRGGPAIMEECRQIRRSRWPEGLPPGEAVQTIAGRLKAKNVIHTVGPVWRGGHSNEQEILQKCYFNSLELADSLGLESISFPSISTGAYGYPIIKAGRVAIGTVISFVREHIGTLKEVRFVLFSHSDYSIYQKMLQETIGD